MLGVIEKIERVLRHQPLAHMGSYWCQTFDGWIVKTSLHEFFLGVSDYESCCESWGTVSSDDDPKALIGQELIDIELTDTALEVGSIAIKEQIAGLDEGGIQFMTLKTAVGDFQIAVYNAHNGYYGHEVMAVKDGEPIFEGCI